MSEFDFNQHPHRSYYTVGDRKFVSKILALAESTKTGLYPKWHFNDEVFGAVKWDQGHVQDILAVYRQRARQLRERYDYLVLAYSGGADSRTALEAFLSQGLAVDEIITSWPMAINQGKYTPSTDTRTANVLSEYDLVIKPDLDYISKHYPNIRITFNDFSQDMASDLTEMCDQDWFASNDHLNPGTYKKYTPVTDTEIKMIGQGKRTATIWGVDKPQLAYKDGNIYLYFLDKLANTRSSDNHNYRASELFYWTPDMPELVHAQARLVYEFFIKNPQYLTLIDWNAQRGREKKPSELNVILKSIVYPSWNPQRFQTDKSTSMVWQETDTWFFENYQHTRYYQSWRSGLDNLVRSIDPKFQQRNPKNNRFDGWIGFISPFYCLGPAYLPG